jgi:5,10-methylenetetrahydrofolate reductase
VGVTTGLRPLPAWKRDADFLLVQVGFSAHDLLEWRSSVDFAGPVYPGVIVIPSAAMARKLSADIAQLAVPEAIIERLEQDRDAGVEIARDLVEQIKETQAFDGVHLIPVSRYREMATRIEQLL